MSNYQYPIIPNKKFSSNDDDDDDDSNTNPLIGMPQDMWQNKFQNSLNYVAKSMIGFRQAIWIKALDNYAFHQKTGKCRFAGVIAFRIL